MPFCDFEKIGRQVAANAFTAKAGCDYPGSITYSLDRACLSQSELKPFDVSLIFKVAYCGQTKLVAALGGGQYKPSKIDPISEWFFAVKP